MEACTQTEKPQQAQNSTIHPPTEEEVKSGTEKNLCKMITNGKRLKSGTTSQDQKRWKTKQCSWLATLNCMMWTPEGFQNVTHQGKNSLYNRWSWRHCTQRGWQWEARQTWYSIPSNHKWCENPRLKYCVGEPDEANKKLKIYSPHQRNSYRWAFLDFTAPYWTKRPKESTLHSEKSSCKTRQWLALQLTWDVITCKETGFTSPRMVQAD